MLGRLFTRPNLPKVANALYRTALAQARRPAFYAEAGVPDTVDGRFDMIALHIFLVLRRLKSQPDARELSQAVFDAMFADMDRALREMGTGDLSVGRRVKEMARAFYGRVSAYDDALAGDEADLPAALVRNLYRGAAPDGARLAAISGYVRREASALDGWPLEALLRGRVSFGPPPRVAENAETS